MFMKILVIMCVAFACAMDSSLASLVLSEGGVAKAAIVISPGASESDRQAAKSLKKYLDEITGGNFPLLENGVAGDLPQTIYVGSSDTVKKLLPTVDWTKLGSDAVVIKTAPGTLILAGGEPRGTLYAVYQFLEDVVGCGWWTAKVRTIPSQPDLSIPDLSVVYSPPFFYRDVYARGLVREDEFSVQMRRNGTTGESPGADVLPAEWGGSIQIAGHVHTFDKFLPASKYFKDHPEWGALIGGTRQSWDQTRAQLCLSNPALIAKFTEAVMQQIKEYPDAKIVSVSMNDNTYRCECEQCVAIEKEEGALSGPMIRFVNAIAKEVEKTRPDILIETLAYFYTVTPPKLTRPASNVIIRLTTYMEDHRLPFAENAGLVKKLKSWEDISSQLFVWDYQPDFHDAWKVRPNILTMADNIHFFQHHKVRGYFMEAEERPTDFFELRTWLASQLLWNPNANGEKLVQRFLDGYYGAAADSLYAYLKLMQEELPAENTIMTGFGKARLPYRVETLNKAKALFDQAAEKVAGDETLTKRVQKERLALDYLRILRYPELATDAEKQALFATQADAEVAADAFVADVERLGIPLKQAAGFGLNPHNATEAAEILKVRLPSTSRPLSTLPASAHVLTFPAAQLDLWGYGSAVTLTSDANAESGVVARLPIAAEAWAVQLDISDSMLGKKWKVFVVARAEGESPASISVGLYDRVNYRSLLTRKFTLKPGDRFQTLALGEMTLDPSTYLYVSAAVPYSNDAAALVERIYFVEAED